MGVGYFYQTLEKQSPFQGFTAGLQIPLFGGVNKNRAKAAKIGVEQAQLELDRSKLAIKLQKERLLMDFQKQQKNLNYFQNEGLQYADEIITTSEKSYANGDMSYWVYITFLNQAIDIKKQYVESVNSYNQSAIELQYPTISNE